MPKPSATEDNPAAADLLRQVNQAEMRKDWTTARSLLDKAQAVNLKQPYLWSNYGFLAAQDHRMSEAIADEQKELALHPYEVFVSRMLAATFMQQNNPDSAITALHAAISLTPSDESLVIFLAAIYTHRNDNSSSEKVLRAGLAAVPTGLALKLQLGTTLLADQKTTEGEALLHDVASTSTDPLQLNNAAYELANASLDLPLAETTSLHSLDLLDQASNNGETGPHALFCASLIVSTWDTYGWILYRENKTTEAEPWIRAAWRNGNFSEAGYHLAMLLEKENHPAEALNQLQLAKVAEHGSNSAAVQKLIADETAKLLKPGPPPNNNNASSELQDQRTYKLSRGDLKPAGQGWATVELDVNPQATSAFRLVDGDQSLQPLSDTVQRLNLNLQLPPPATPPSCAAASSVATGTPPASSSSSQPTAPSPTDAHPHRATVPRPLASHLGQATTPGKRDQHPHAKQGHLPHPQEDDRPPQ